MFRYIECPSSSKHLDLVFFHVSLYIALLFDLATFGISVHHLLKASTYIYFFEEFRVLEFKTNSLVAFSDLKQNIVDTNVDLHGNLLTQ